MARPRPDAPEVSDSQHAVLVAACEAWAEGAKTDGKVMTMADGALKILGEVGWANHRWLPNEAVHSLAFSPAAPPGPYNTSYCTVVLYTCVYQ